MPKIIPALWYVDKAEEANKLPNEETRVVLNSEQWAAFMTALDAAPASHPRMERLLKEPNILD
jgi:uncharacterized protein (DUF1778 family)